MKLSADNRVVYAQSVWAAFQNKARTHRDMSSAEFNLVRRWLDRGVPLFVVLRGINDFTGKPGRLEAVEQSVERSVGYWHKAAGGLTELPKAGPLEDPPEEPFDVEAARKRRDELLAAVRSMPEPLKP